uniref:(northern house mosquito) hypothetical protein n=1 Tax=Culex pipiens TaxID=7175 RepID=A0A8D8KQN3_CULPI
MYRVFCFFFCLFVSFVCCSHLLPSLVCCIFCSLSLANRTIHLSLLLKFCSFTYYPQFAKLSENEERLREANKNYTLWEERSLELRSNKQSSLLNYFFFILCMIFLYFRKI